jgi:hypothetical protein
MKTYSGTIHRLLPHQVFVFGSNTQGRHGKGAALWAKLNAGAVYGQAKGIQGRAYGIVTKNLTKYIHPSVSVEDIVKQIEELYAFARENSDKEFVVAYSGSGNNLNGYSPEQMAGMFVSSPIPDNLVFEETMAELIKLNNE